MALDLDNGDYLGSYGRFFKNFIANLNPDDQLPVKINGFDITESEIVGEIIDMSLQYLNQKYCPPSLQAHIVRLVLEEVNELCRKQPEDCGLKPHENTYGPLKLMQAVTIKVKEICYRYLDNSRLALLPPPPSTPLPLVTTYAIKNTRRKMEDRSVVLHDLNTMFSINNDSLVNYYAVFDGHRGQDASVYCAAHLHQYLVEGIHYPSNPVLALRDAFLTADARFIQKQSNSGSTAVVALLVNKILYIAWAGDSQAALVKNGRAEQLVNPHKPERLDERERVENMGGNVIHYGTWRVNGHLSVSRSIGDKHYKPFITGEPEVKTIPLDGTEDFLVVACDGFWDSVDEVRTASVVYEVIERDPQNYTEASRNLVELARGLRSNDNISVIVVFLTHPTEIAEKLKRHRSSLASRMDSSSPQDVQHPANYNSVDDGSYPFQKNFGSQDEISVQHPESFSAVDAGCCPYEINFVKIQPRERIGGHIDPKELIFKKASPNGKPKNGSPKYNDDDEDEDEDDLGPETDVDAVDDATEVRVPLEKISRELFPEKRDSESEKCLSEEEKFQTESPASPGPETEFRQHELLPEADNVADSEDSEDEWNYYRVEPDKDKDSSVLLNEPSSESKEEKEVCSTKPLVEDDTESKPLKEKSNSNSNSEAELETPLPGLTDTECIAETENPDEDFTFRKEIEHETEDMAFHLNPDAKEFIPPSMIPQPRSFSDYPVSGSPLKQMPTVMDDILIPSESEFDAEVSNRPRDIEDGSSPISKPLDPDFKPSFDDSEISSTKAEFGDESTTSFLTTSEFQRTGISAMDCSFTGSDNEDYDISKDPMAMSLTPGDFEAAFDKAIDLNAVHDLSDVDFSDNVNGVNDQEIQCPEFESMEQKDEYIMEKEEPVPPFVLDSAAETLERNSQNPFNLEILKESLKEENLNSVKASDLESEKVEVDACLFNSNTVSSTEDFQERNVSESENSQFLGDFSPEEKDASPVAQDSAFGSSFDPVSQLGFQLALQPEITEVPVIESHQQNIETFDPFFENKENIFEKEEEEEEEELEAKETFDKQVEIAEFESEIQPKDIEFDPEIQEKSQTQFELSLEADNVEQYLDETDKSVPIETEKIEANEIFEQKTNYAPVLNLSESLQEFTGLERQVNEAKELENIIEYAQVIETTVPKEHIDVEQKDVVENLINDNDLIGEETRKVEESKSEVPVVAAAVAGAAVVAATTAAVKATKKPTTTVSKTSTTKTSTGSKPTKSMPTSPTKTTTAARTSATAAKKPSTGTISRPKQLDTKSAISTTSKSPAFKASPAPKTTTTTAKLTPRLSAAAPKPKTPISSPKPASAVGDKKPTTNGDAKLLTSKPATSKPPAKPTSASATRTTLVKSSSTTRNPTSSIAATSVKSRLVSSSTITKTAPKTTTTTTNRPKTAPATTGSTLGSAKPRVSSAKSPMIDKQIKETANKQISSSRVSSANTAKTSRSSTSASTTSTIVKRTSTSTLKVSTTATSANSPSKKPAPISKNYKPLTKSTAKTAVSTTVKKNVENGNCEVQKIETVTTTTATTTNIEEDVPQKDISPIAPPTDNQLIMTSE